MYKKALVLAGVATFVFCGVSNNIVIAEENAPAKPAEAVPADKDSMMKAFPPAESGMSRYVLFLPPQKDESGFRVELIAGKTIATDGVNNYFLGGKIEEEIIDFCKGRLASYKKPKSVEFLKELPRTPSGKVMKKLLRDRYWSGREVKV